MSAPHKCPGPGCRKGRYESTTMCSDHWKTVPMELKRAFWNAWDRATEPHQDEASRIRDQAEYVKAAQACVDFVMKATAA